MLALRQLTQIITDKEKKSSSYRDGKLDSLSEEKEGKIKKFAKEYIAKVLRKIEKSGRRPHGSASTRMSASASTANNTPSTSMATPSSNDGSDSRTHGNAMSVEEAMGIELHSDSEHADEDDDEDEEDDGQKIQAYPHAGPSSTMLPPKIPPRAADPYVQGEDSMDVDDVHFSTSDPRRRHPMDIH